LKHPPRLPDSHPRIIYMASMESDKRQLMGSCRNKAIWIGFKVQFRVNFKVSTCGSVSIENVFSALHWPVRPTHWEDVVFAFSLRLEHLRRGSGECDGKPEYGTALGPCGRDTARICGM